MYAIQSTLFILICLLLGLTLFYSIRSRREPIRQTRLVYSPYEHLHGIHARSDCHYANLLLQRIQFPPHLRHGTCIDRCFNVFVGIRNHGHFDRMLALDHLGG